MHQGPIPDILDPILTVLEVLPELQENIPRLSIPRHVQITNINLRI